MLPFNDLPTERPPDLVHVGCVWTENGEINKTVRDRFLNEVGVTASLPLRTSHVFLWNFFEEGVVIYAAEVWFKKIAHTPEFDLEFDRLVQKLVTTWGLPRSLMNAS